MEDAKTEIYPTAEVGRFGLTRSSPQGGARMRGNVRKQICVQLASYALTWHPESMRNFARSFILMLLEASYRISSALQCTGL